MFLLTVSELNDLCVNSVEFLLCCNTKSQMWGSFKRGLILNQTHRVRVELIWFQNTIVGNLLEINHRSCFIWGYFFVHNISETLFNMLLKVIAHPALLTWYIDILTVVANLTFTFMLLWLQLGETMKVNIFDTIYCTFIILCKFIYRINNILDNMLNIIKFHNFNTAMPVVIVLFPVFHTYWDGTNCSNQEKDDHGNLHSVTDMQYVINCITNLIQVNLKYSYWAKCWVKHPTSRKNPKKHHHQNINNHKNRKHKD